MLRPFNPEKVIQACGVLLKQQESGIITRLRLLKLLYMADRKSLQTIGHSITGDQAVAMRNGPVLSRTYKLIKNKREEEFLDRWNKYFGVTDQYLRLKEDPGTDALSRFEVATLEELSRQYAECDDWEVAEKTHQFPEWKKNAPQGGRKMKKIPLDDVLSALGMEDQKDDLLSEERQYRAFDELFTPSPPPGQW